MDAWIDCMDEFVVESTILDLGDCRQLKKNHPEIIKAIVECSAIVNYRKLERGEQPTILVSMFV